MKTAPRQPPGLLVICQVASGQLRVIASVEQRRPVLYGCLPSARLKDLTRAATL